MENIYCISGLGADKRIFANLRLNSKNITYIDWIKPKKNESLSDYCQRLIDGQIKDTDNIVLIGVSFGGIVASEIAKLIKVKQVIIISSVKTRAELPNFLTSSSFAYFKYLISPKLVKYIPQMSYILFGANTIEEKQLLKNIIKITDNSFMLWAINAMASWKNDIDFANLIHIHGTHDKLFDIKNKKNTIPINGGSHFMIYNRADEISKIINQYI